ncbi:MAG: 30S ribosomal protein S9 [Verrucomicrobiota bacterium]|nr:30S ribosomal protein S9 [Verrucomicrobiota bacterium]
MVAKKEYWATGRRKSAVASVKAVPGNGHFKVNKSDISEYFPVETLRGYLMQPLAITGLEDQYDFTINVKGGGKSGQAGAIRLGIARMLEKVDPDLRNILKESGLLTRDARVKERKKSGQPGARKRFQFSKR